MSIERIIRNTQVFVHSLILYFGCITSSFVELLFSN